MARFRQDQPILILHPSEPDRRIVPAVSDVVEVASQGAAETSTTMNETDTMIHVTASQSGRIGRAAARRPVAEKGMCETSETLREEIAMIAGLFQGSTTLTLAQLVLRSLDYGPWIPIVARVPLTYAISQGHLQVQYRTCPIIHLHRTG